MRLYWDCCKDSASAIPFTLTSHAYIQLGFRHAALNTNLAVSAG